MCDFYKDCAQRFNVSVRGMLKSDFIGKLAIKQEASKSKTVLAKEKVLYCVIIAC